MTISAVTEAITAKDLKCFFLNLMCHSHQKHLETELNKATTRNGIITNLFSKTYEDNVSGKLSDEMFMELSHKYEVERLELKAKIFEYKERLAKISEMEQNNDKSRL